MSSNLKRVVSGLILLLCILNAAACSNEAGSGDETSGNADNVTTSQSSEDSEELKPDLPDVNYNGREFRLGYHTQDNTESLLFKETDTGEIVDTAIYNRNLALEEKYGIKMKFINSGFSAGEFAEKLNAAILGGDDSYDVCIGNGNYFVKYLASLPYVDYNDVPYLEFDKPWWNKANTESLTLCGKMYLYSPMVTQ